MDIREKVLNRLFKYVKVYTTSDESSSTIPSTDRQLNLAKILKQELEDMGLEVRLSEYGYVYAKLNKNSDGMPAIGLIAHMDTAPDMTGENVNPRVIENYDGKDIDLSGDGKYVLSKNDFPELSEKVGKTLVVTDGNTLLGADDKAGIAEIMTTIEYLLENPQIKHGDICIGFTPDEEIGRGADQFDVKNFGAEFAFTIDGGEIGGLEYENFNAASAKVTIEGRNVHPGSAKGKMKNSIIYSYELFSMLPVFDRPEHTEGREGFIHLNDIVGNVDKTEMYFIIRDHDINKFEEKKSIMRAACEYMENKHGIKITLQMEDSYYNMKNEVEKDMRPVNLAMEAMKKAGVEPLVTPIRGGTDGARLSYMGLVCPNIFTGGYNFHGRFEYAVVEEMVKAVETIINIVSK